MHGKIILLKTPYTIHLASRHREVFETNRKLPPCWLGFIVSEGAVQSAGREETSMVLPSVEPHMPQYKPARQAVPLVARVRQLFGVTICSLIGFETCSTGWDSCLILKP